MSFCLVTELKFLILSSATKKNGWTPRITLQHIYIYYLTQHSLYSYELECPFIWKSISKNDLTKTYYTGRFLTWSQCCYVNGKTCDDVSNRTKVISLSVSRTLLFSRLPLTIYRLSFPSSIRAASAINFGPSMNHVNFHDMSIILTMWDSNTFNN